MTTPALLTAIQAAEHIHGTPEDVKAKLSPRGVYYPKTGPVVLLYDAADVHRMARRRAQTREAS